MQEINKPTDIGVLISRFQFPELQESHLNLINGILKNHDKVIVLLGISPTKSTKNNPLDFTARKQMILEKFPTLTVLPINDIHNDEDWSKDVDKKIREVYAIGSVSIYGSRDGFIPYYKGSFPTIELEPTHNMSGSEVRAEVFKKGAISHKYYRVGVIHACHDKYPTSYTTVDAAILDGKGNVLLGRKNHDPKGKWRFIGGFVDINQDTSLEEAVKREVLEETNSLGVGEPVYIGSAHIDDWRYRNEQDGIMTTFFAIPYVFGKPEAKDDIDDLQWFSVIKLVENEGFQVVKEHHVLLNLLNAHLHREQKQKEQQP